MDQNSSQSSSTTSSSGLHTSTQLQPAPVPQNSVPQQPSKPWYLRTVLLLIAVLAVIAVIVSWIDFAKQPTFDNSTATIKSTPSTTSTPPPITTATLLQAAKSVPITQDQYGLFSNTKINQSNNFVPLVQYKDDGIIQSGKYTGYHRLIGFETSNEPVPGYYYAFATQDYKTFVVDTPIAPYAENNYSDNDSGFNKVKVIAEDNIPLNQPVTISAGNFVLIRNLVDFDAPSATSTQLSSLIPGLMFYNDPSNTFLGSETTTTSAYLAGKTDIYVQDKEGVTFDYYFESVEEYNRQKTTSYDYNFYNQNEIESSSGVYQQYGQLFPGGCGALNTSFVLQNISARDLVQIGTTKAGMNLYTLKDQNHPLDKQEYQAKVTDWRDEFPQMNNGQPIPSYQHYVVKNPVLIFQDPWRRYVGIGEWQYMTGGGCGKPVVYLYPTKPTPVTVKFENSMRFTTDIPIYAGEWRVLAHPDGTLKDLQPEKTDCSSINYRQDGSEYSKQACSTAMYPYLYWAGQTVGIYPTPTGGWVVDRSDVHTFLDQKLSEVGLNAKEKSDMLSYWVPALLAKDVPYYRISFFQTQQMNKFMPMQVTPQPDTVFRLFLDWSPLSAKPAIAPSSQVLAPLVRKGFTLVEWGGLKR